MHIINLPPERHITVTVTRVFVLRPLVGDGGHITKQSSVCILLVSIGRMEQKLVHGIENWKYDDRLKFLGLTRLDKRSIRSDLVETFKIRNGFYNINKGLFSDLDDGGRRSHEKKLFKGRFHLDTRKFVFNNRVVVIGIHYLHSVSIAAPLTHLSSMFQFNRNRNPVIIWK